MQYQFDPLGDAVHCLDGDGDVTANRLWDAWGNELTSGSTDPRGYRARYGYYTDQGTGLVAMTYRYYLPGVGRFLNRDPIRYWGGVSLHAYVGSRPVGFVDRTGTFVIILIGLLACAAAVVVIISGDPDEMPKLLGDIGDAAGSVPSQDPSDLQDVRPPDYLGTLPEDPLGTLPKE